MNSISDEDAVKALGNKAIKQIIESGEFIDDQYEKLFDIYEGEMPYGTKKARTGDPQQFIYYRLAKINFKNKKKTTGISRSKMRK